MQEPTKDSYFGNQLDSEMVNEKPMMASGSGLNEIKLPLDTSFDTNSSEGETTLAKINEIGAGQLTEDSSSSTQSTSDPMIEDDNATSKVKEPRCDAATAAPVLKALIQNFNKNLTTNNASKETISPEAKDKDTCTAQNFKFNFDNIEIEHNPKTPSGPEEWRYSMRRQMQEILPGLYLGPYIAATPKNLEVLKAAGVSHIICVRHDSEKHLIRPRMPEYFSYWVVEMHEIPNEPLVPLFEAFYQHVDSHLKDGETILVHSNTGMGRSAVLVISYLMRTKGFSRSEAVSFVQHKRFCICPHESFLENLDDYEPIARIHLKNSLRESISPETTPNSSLKRTHSECELR